MKELSLDELKRIELEMFICFDKVCRCNNIYYSLTYGTLIGAIRHNGFIPWDDDIDIMMDRDNYEKFLSVWKDCEYKLFTLKKGSEFWPLFSRITNPRTHLEPEKICNHGVWIAVIPYDKVPDDDEEFKKHMKRVSIYLKVLELKRENIKVIGQGNVIKNSFYKTLQFALKPFTPYFIGSQIERIKTKYRDTNYKRVNPWTNDIIVLTESKYFNEYIDVEFEGVKAMAIKDYDIFLRSIYGDYMQYPPEKDRIPKHGFKAYIED